MYTDRYYGTLKKPVEQQREEGMNVIFDVDVKGGCRIKEYLGEEALSIFIMPPSVEELRRRLIARATDDMEQIEKRLAKAEYEIGFAPRFDHVVINDNLQEAQQRTLLLVKQFVGL